MKKTDYAINILTALQFKGIGNSWIVKNLPLPSQPEELVFIINKKSKSDISLETFLEKKAEVRQLLNQIHKEIGGFQITAIGDDNFPQWETQTTTKIKESDIPVVLFYKGDISLLKNSRTIAVIGLLNPTPAIVEQEQKIVAQFVQRGASIVSGLAVGCDSIAHLETLRQGGKTIAILPSPLNDILPKSNRAMADEIVKKGGLLITEYYRPISSRNELTTRYIRRDRLQALFSHCVVLAASYAKNDLGNDCGSRHAMGKALEYGIPRAVLYNEERNGNDPMFDLNREVMKETPTTIVINEELPKKLEELLQRTRKQKPSQLNLFA